METTNNIINKALAILKGHDFYYMMVDYGYASAAAKAKANMKFYVETIKQLPNDLYNLMRELWISEYNYCSCFRPCWTSEEAPKCKEEMDRLHAVVEAILNNNEMAMAA